MFSVSPGALDYAKRGRSYPSLYKNVSNIKDRIDAVEMRTHG